jgi:hypothetical protein
LGRWYGGQDIQGDAHSNPTGTDDMTRIEISAAAYAAIVAGRPPNTLIEAQASPLGGFYLWLDQTTVAKLKYARAPGESFSETILRLAA